MTAGAGRHPMRDELAAVERLAPIDSEQARVEIERLVRHAREHDLRWLEGRARLVLVKLALDAWDVVEANDLLEQASFLNNSDVDIDRLTYQILVSELLAKSHQPDATIPLASEIQQRCRELEGTTEFSPEIDGLLWRSTSHIALSFRDLGRYEEALVILDELEGRSPPEGRDVFALGWRANRAHVLVDLARPEEGAAEFAAVKDGFEAIGAKGYARRASVFLAHALAHQGQIAAAFDVMQSVHEYFEIDGADAYDWTHEAYDLDSARLVMAEVYWMMGASSTALDLLSSSLSNWPRWVLVRDVRRVFQMLADLLAESSPERSLALLDSLLDMSNALPDELARARIVLRIFELFPDHESPELLDDAAHIIEQQGGDSDVLRLSMLRVDRSEPSEAGHYLDAVGTTIGRCSDINILWQYYFRVGRVALRQSRPSDAHEALVQAVELLRTVWSTIPDERLRMRHRSAHSHVVDELTCALLELELADELFELIEESYAVTLEERIHGAVPASEWPRVSAELTAIYGRMAGADDGEWRSLDLRATQLERVRSLDESDIGARPSRATMSPSVELPAVSAPEHCAVFGVCREEVFVLLRIDSGPITLIRNVCTTADLAELRLEIDLQRRRCDLLALGEHHDQLNALTDALLTQLYDRLLSRAVQATAEELQLGAPRPFPIQVVLVPPPGFDDLPFAAARQPGGAIVHRTGICTAPSTTLASWASQRARSGRSTLAIGVPADGLRYPEIEAERIGEVVGARILTGPQATVQRLTELAPQYDVVHIATHGLARPDPWFNGMQLADGWLTTAQLAHWSLDGQIVVLSGCDTGQQSASGHELLGLPRALLAAGAGGVIASISSLDDETVVDFMVLLHQNLVSCGPAEALRRTQQTFAAEGTNLRQWASMVYIGGPDRPSVPRHEPALA